MDGNSMSEYQYEHDPIYSQSVLDEIKAELEEVKKELDAWREMFPVAGFDGNGIVMCG